MTPRPARAEAKRYADLLADKSRQMDNNQGEYRRLKARLFLQDILPQLAQAIEDAKPAQ